MAIINGCCGFGNSYTFVKNENKYNFDVDGDWDLQGITSKEQFETLLSVTVTAFEYNGKNIKAFITGSPSVLNFDSMNLVSNINYITVEGIVDLNLMDNNIEEFNPSKKLPSTLHNLNLSLNQLRFFKPDFKLPLNLATLNLSNNQITSAGYTDSEVWANEMYIAPTGGGVIDFGANIDSVSGTNLQTILVAKNWNVTA